MAEEEQPDWKYTLIVSQYYHSRFCFIVKLKDDFIEKAKGFAKELMAYKRYKNKEYRDDYIGDLKYFNKDKIHSAYYINDAGDIYFINYTYANKAMEKAADYYMQSKRDSVGYKRKQIVDDIAEHHSYKVISEIVQKYFEIA